MSAAKTLFCLTLCLAAALLAPAARAAEPSATTPTDTSATPAGDPLATGRRYTAWFYAGETARVWERFSAGMKSAIGGADKLALFREQVAAQVGKEERVLDEKVTAAEGAQIYLRTVKFSGAATPVDVQWTLTADGTVIGFFIRPKQQEAASRFLDYIPKTPLALPFAGTWRVAWGGRSLADNAHAFTVDQRFAYDFVIVKDGTTHEGNGAKNEQYYAFGQPIEAPAAGKVVAVADGIDDNVPSEMNGGKPFGNFVVLDHGNGEFSVLAHLKKGSVAVKVGDEVAAGRRLGLCGNSGNSSEPHLHYHLQNTATPGQGEGLPAPFVRYRAGGKEVLRGEPTKGQAIERGEAPAG
jgi:murein DD-endopeptidase MepM/ murein hydrolase activator NlpD